jgi:hypothetical protein
MVGSGYLDGSSPNTWCRWTVAGGGWWRLAVELGEPAASTLAEVSGKESGCDVGDEMDEESSPI